MKAQVLNMNSSAHNTPAKCQLLNIKNASLTNFSKDHNVNIMDAGAEVTNANGIVHRLQTKQTTENKELNTPQLLSSVSLEHFAVS